MKYIYKKVIHDISHIITMYKNEIMRKNNHPQLILSVRLKFCSIPIFFTFFKDASVQKCHSYNNRWIIKTSESLGHQSKIKIDAIYY